MTAGAASKALNRRLGQGSALGPGCVKTLKSQQGEELFSLLPFFSRGRSAIPL
jgi:hypothetical protein